MGIGRVRTVIAMAVACGLTCALFSSPSAAAKPNDQRNAFEPVRHADTRTSGHGSRCVLPDGRPCVKIKVFKRKLRKGRYGVLGRVNLARKANRHARKKYQRAVRRYRHHHNGRAPRYAKWRGFKRHLRCLGNGNGKKRRHWCSANRKRLGIGHRSRRRGWDWLDGAFNSVKKFWFRCDGSIVGFAIAGGGAGALAGGVGALPGAGYGALFGAGSCEGKHLYNKFVG